jgi:M6 family metalloprotease-like protein
MRIGSLAPAKPGRGFFFGFSGRRIDGVADVRVWSDAPKMSIIAVMPLSLLLPILAAFNIPGPSEPISLSSPASARAALVAARTEGQVPETAVGTRRYLVVPVRFSGHDTTYSSAQIGGVFDSTGPTLNVRRYFKEQSRGKFDPVFRILPWMTTTVARDSIAMSVANIRTYMSQIVQQAGQFALAQGETLSVYDNDKDGAVDGIIIVFAGSAWQISGDEKDPPTCHVLTTGVAFSGGLTAYTAQFIGEVASGRLFSPGEPAHEIGHNLGLSDLYDLDGATHGYSEGLGTWDLMAAGESGMTVVTDGVAKWYVSGLSAFCRYQVGWVQPVEIGTSQEVSLHPGEAARLWLDPFRTGDYVMLENRDRSGVDSSIPGPGLLAVRVQSSQFVTRSMNQLTELDDDSGDLQVGVLEASGLQRLAKGTSKWAQSNDLFGIACDTLTPRGPVPFALGKGVDSSQIWLRGIRVSGTDVSFQANSVPQRGYGLRTDSGTFLVATMSDQKASLLVPLKITAAGRIVGIRSTVSNQQGEVCAGIWTTRPSTYEEAVSSTMCDTGTSLQRSVRRFEHTLAASVEVQAGQVVWVGQTISRPGTGRNVLAGDAIDTRTDTTLYYASGVTPSVLALRPDLEILVESDAKGSSVRPGTAARLFQARMVGKRLQLDGIPAGETVRLALRDLNGRTLWNGGLEADASGSARMSPPVGQARLLVLEIRGSFGTKALNLTAL